MEEDSYNNYDSQKIIGLFLVNTQIPISWN